MNKENTTMFQLPLDRGDEIRNARGTVCAALREKGYDPIGQIVGYIMSGDPSYITAHNGARTLIQRLETDEILEELVKFYVEEK